MNLREREHALLKSPGQSMSVMILLVALSVLWLEKPSSGQDAGSAQTGQSATEDSAPDIQGQTAIGVRQKRVARLMKQLDQRFLTLARTLEKTEPERAQRLIKAYEASSQSLIENRMREIASLLDQARYEPAGVEEEKILEDVRSLMEILLMESQAEQENREEVERLKKWHQQVSALFREEQLLRLENQTQSNREAALAELEKLVAAVESLLEREQDLQKQIDAVAAQDSKDLERLSGDQDSLARNTEFVHQQLGRLRDQAAGMPTDQLPPAPGQLPLMRSVGHLRTATQALQQQQAKPARSEGDQAIRHLQEALKELRAEADRLKNSSEDSSEKSARQQQELDKKAEEFQKTLEEATAEGKPGEATRSASSKGMDKARQSMAKATSQLENKDLKGAANEQKQTEQQLEDVRKEIEKRLNELGEQPSDEAVSQLVIMLTAMLERHRAVADETIRFHTAREGQMNELRRADRITLRRLGQEELDLSEQAGKALLMVEEDGTTVSFPAVIQDLKDLLLSLSEKLGQNETGPATQQGQAEAITILEELIEALKSARGQKDGEPSPPKPGKNKPGLLPGTAELKLLRQMQLRINHRTELVRKARLDQAPTPEQTRELARLAESQIKVAGMVRALIQRTQEASSPLLNFPGQELLKGLGQ